MDIRRATPGDLEDAASLLRTAGLPPIPDEVPLANILLALDGARIVGVIAVQVVARRGLARSAAVESAYQRQGVGASLLRSLIARAHELGLRDLYLLTEDAEGFFAGLGFAAVARDAVPEEIQATHEYREQCPETATVMRLALATRY